MQLQNQDLNYHPTTLLSIPHFMLSWEENRELEPNQAAIMERLNIRYNGKKVWPQINQIKPGNLPCIASIREFKNIGILLGQCLDVLPRAIRNREMLWEHQDNTNTFLFRIPKKVRGEWVWHDEFREPTITPVLSQIRFHPIQLEKYKRLPVKWKTLQIDLVLQPYPIANPDGTLKYHFMMLGLDPKTELIIMAQMVKSGKRYETTLNNIPNLMIKDLIASGGRPAKLEFRNPDIFTVMKFFEDLAGTQVVFKENLEPLGAVTIKLIDQLVKAR